MSDAERQIQQFNDAVIRLENQGQYERALDLAREIRGIVRQTFGLTHPLYATALHNLGKVHSSLGNYERAKSLYREALRIRRRRLGPDHRDVATTINNLGNLYRSLGDYDRAIRLCRQALEIRRRTLGENHSAFAESLHNLATLYRERGDYARAAPLARQALDVCRQTLGEKHSAYAQGLTSLAELHRLRGDYASAEPLVRQALEIFRTVFGENHSDFATGLNNLGNLLHARGDFTAAEPLFQQAIEIQRRSLGEHHPLVAVSGDNLAVLYYVRGDYTRAEPLFQQVLAIRRKALGEDHPDYALALNNLALLYFALGDYNRAEPLWRQAGEVFRRRLGENHPNFALTLNNLATMYQSMGDFVAAERYHRQALEVRRAAVGEQHPDYAQTLGNIGYLYHLMADYGRAETLYRQAMEIVRRALGEDHPDFALHLNNLALTHWSQGEYEKAEPLARQANEVQRRALGEDHPTFAIGLNNLANLCMMRGEYRKAEGLLQQTLEIYRRALGEDHSSVAQGLNNLAEVYREMGELDRAESLHRQAIALFSRTLGGEHPFSASSIHNLGLIHAARAQFAEALPLLHREAAIETRLLGQVFAVGSESQRAALLRYIENTLDLILTLAANHLAADPGAVAAALDLVLRRKAIAAEALAAQRDAVLGGRHTVLRPRLERLTLLRRQIARNTLAGPGPEGPQAHREQLASWDAEKDGIEAELARQIPEMRLQQQLDQADHRAVALGLPPGVALVEFARYDIFDFTAVANKVSEDRWEPVRPWRPGNYLAFVLRAGEPETVAMIDLGKAAPINQLIADLRSEITEEANPTGLESAGVRLRRLIFDPLRKALGGRDQLLIVPDGDLARLPFEVLPTDDGRCLLDAYSITYLASGRDVLRLGAAPTRTPGSPIVVADPDFDYGLADIGSSSAAETGTMRGRHARDSDLAAEPFDTLPGARVEGEEVARLIGDALGTKVEPWLGAQALESRLKAVSSPWIVHLATHGFFMADQRSATGPPSADRGIIGGEERIGPALENPMLRSGLALAGANGMHKKFVPPPDAEDGLLTAEDVAGLDLIDTELVVLSACETGLGQIRVGEGVFGLRRAFVAAGARALVMSLWKVPDDATRELMSDFYRLILAGKPRAESLRQAQLSVRQRYSQPFFWGAFILQGDPGPLLAQAPVTDQIGG